MIIYKKFAWYLSLRLKTWRLQYKIYIHDQTLTLYFLYSIMAIKLYYEVLLKFNSGKEVRNLNVVTYMFVKTKCQF